MNLPTAADIRDQIELALAAGGVSVGTYTHPGGQTSAAISVGDPEAGTEASGLEVLIARNPDRKILSGFEFLGFVEEWPVKFINWDNADLEDAANAIAAVFHPLADDPKILPASPDDPEQLFLKLTADPV
ncbi:hypothetical protein GCM10022631_29580 [Deinococcus rubellus]|uniref:Uncharacterized protein n=1 Tax=Deinococcus rubellus TaxID=1889240 RepID=A0ABY5YGZ2_9DEIO|nr:hypothetical protein [Deinococcus rubellus]UWX64196.1 hypothetical protein N0D28_00505 [Deinococcus rubellus]